MKMKSFTRSVMCAIVAGLLVPTTQAGVSQAIWALEIKGALGIQNFSSNLQPQLQTASFNTRNFLSILGASGTLALNVDMRGGTTNIFLSAFDRIGRQNTARLTANETTTILSDGKNLTFTVSAQLRGSGANAGGGTVRLAGRGRLIQGVPGALRGNIDGLIIDARPRDLAGTTGVVLRATMRTGNLLRP